LLHAVRFADGSWTPWGTPSGLWPSFGSVSSSEVGGNLHVMVNNGGHIWHSIRWTATGGWTAFGDFNVVTGFPSLFSDSDGD
jgi:hypothetical protein